MSVQKAAIVVLLPCFLLAGCMETTSERATLGGAATGAIIGGVLGGGTWAVVGAASGAALGWVAGKAIEAREVERRSYARDQQMYGYAAPTDTVYAKINSATTSPKTASPGEVVDVVTDYSIALPSGMSEIEVVSDAVLYKDGEKLMEFKGEPIKRTDGGYKILLPVNVPKEAAPGTYVIEHSLRAGTIHDKAESTFIVRS